MAAFMDYTGSMGKAVYIIIQFTWGILQSLAGACVLLAHIRFPHRMHHGAVVTSWPSHYGLSLGMFIFIPQELDAAESDLLLVHEYGHTLQSLALGPLYLPIVGLPSIIYARSKRLRSKRRSSGASYYGFYTERWASSWGERVLKRPAIR